MITIEQLDTIRTALSEATAVPEYASSGEWTGSRCATCNSYTDEHIAGCVIKRALDIVEQELKERDGGKW